MNRFFCANPVISGKRIIIEDKEKIHHIRGVLCLKPKEKILVFDRGGIEYRCSILELGEKVFLEIEEKLMPRKKTGISLTIACAIPKNAKFDDIVDKLTQLGVVGIVPLMTKRVVVRLDRKKEDARIKRWRRIAESSAQQSQRNDIPVVEELKGFKELLAMSNDFDLKLIPTLSGQRKTLNDVLPSSITASHILALIGPEGDFSGDEVSAAKNNGFIPVSLGDLVLRVDTAAIAVASIIKNHP